MTGPEHYREAERLAAESYHEDKWEADDKLLARAQVHATLALAAATALGDVILTLPVSSQVAAEWNHAIGTAP